MAKLFDKKYKRLRLRDLRTGRIRYSFNNGDAVSRALLGADKDEIVATIDANGLTEHFKRHIETKTPGMLRMYLGQSLRGKVQRGKPVTIRGINITSLDQNVPFVGYVLAPKVMLD